MAQGEFIRAHSFTFSRAASQFDSRLSFMSMLFFPKMQPNFARGAFHLERNN
jgi:hypothetical protein